MPITERSILQAAKDQIKLFTSRHPVIFFALNSIRRSHRHLAVGRSTELIIEGFPRSANTFATVAFEYAQRRNVNVAHHLHSPAQIIRAAEWKIPAIVLIRNPRDAVVSLVIRHPHVSLGFALRSYISFYDTVAVYRRSYVLAEFREVTTDYGQVIKRVNEKFQYTRFSLFEHSEENVRRVFSIIETLNRASGSGKILHEQVARPSAYRFSLKETLRAQMENSESARQLLDRAWKVYLELAGH